VTSESIVKLRLSVWRDFVPGATLALWSGEPRAQRVITGDSEIQQEVFSWQMREDPFDGILGDADRAKLRELLLERFEPSSSPRDRRISGLADFVAEADRGSGQR